MPSKTDRRTQFLNDIAYHSFRGAKEEEKVKDKFADLRDAARFFGNAVFDNTEEGRCQSLALTYIEDALMWAIKSVAVSELPAVEE